jgi:flagellar hook protein FlgE
MLSSFFSGISGLVSNSHSINVVGNNIANVNTIGYKASRATFEDVLYQSIFGTSGTSQVGRGSALASVDTLFAQGSFESTSVPTDLAIGGQGFFIARSAESESKYYTRAGQFRFDEEGVMTNPAGYILQGKQIDRTTNSPFGVDTDIVVSPEPSEPKKTEVVGMVVNLQSNAAWKGAIGALSNTGNNIDTVAASTGKYPRSGDYSTTITNRLAAAITHTGSVAPTYNLNGTINLNGTNVTLTNVSTIGGLVAAINGQTATTHIVASAGGAGSDCLTLTSNTNGLDIIVTDSGLTSGGIGWSDVDKESEDLYGSQLTSTVTWLMPDGVPANKTFTGVISSHRGTITNWAGSGLDITTANPAGYVLQATDATHPVQTFTISGFEAQYVSATENPSTTSNYSSSITVYDSLGQPHVVTVYFRKAYEDTVGAAQTAVWEWHATLSGTDSASGQDEDVKWGYLTFNNNGVLTSGGEAQKVSFNFSQGAEAEQSVEIVFGVNSGGGSTTQYPIASKTNFQSQDGYPPGVLMNVTVNQDGIISGHYSNGQILDLYQITLANFNNPWGLHREGGNLFSGTIESGSAYTNAPGEGGVGKINPNSLEQSNVDLATEFVKMIIAQRGFQANSRVITTTDEILQELMNIKR